MSKIIRLEEVMELKGGDNHHQRASLVRINNFKNEPFTEIELYNNKVDLGKKVRTPGSTNIFDISACLRTSLNLGDFYKGTETEYIAIASKHTRPVVIAKGKTQLEATIKAIAGDLNSPFGGFWGFNKPLDYDTAKFLDKTFFEGIIAPDFEKNAIEKLTDTTKIKSHQNRFLIKTGDIKLSDLNILDLNIQFTPIGYGIIQDYDKPYKVKEEAVVVTSNKGKTDIISLDKKILDDIEFAGNVAMYLNSNLVFFVYNGAIAGLGDGCGSRVVAAEKARMMLDRSAYFALAENTDKAWKKVLYDTPFKREEFEFIGNVKKITAGFSDAFYPKLDGFIETTGIDRIDKRFQDLKFEYTEDGEIKVFIPKRENFSEGYNHALLPEVIVQPGGSLGDKLVLPLAEEYNIKMVFTMTPEVYNKYKEKGPGKGISGRRFFSHVRG